jgi:hypothetical protein
MANSEAPFRVVFIKIEDGKVIPGADVAKFFSPEVAHGVIPTLAVRKRVAAHDLAVFHGDDLVPVGAKAEQYLR